MKLKLAVGMVGVLMLLTMGGCKENQESLDPVVGGKDTQISEPAKGTFDLDYVGTQINIKGQPFTIPVALKDLDNGWTYDVWDEEDFYLDEGMNLVDLYYNGEEMFIASLENYDKDFEEESIIFNFTTRTEEYSIDGLVPLVSTKQEVLAKYGEQTSTDVEDNIYFYGIRNEVGFKGQCLTIVFDENDIVTVMSFTYADLTKEGY